MRLPDGDSPCCTRVENYLNHLGTMQTVRETKGNLDEVLSYTLKALLGHHQI